MNDSSILLSIGVLVSNRGESVFRCLDSLQPIRQAIPCQLIITDTGCEKGLREQLEAYLNTGVAGEKAAGDQSVPGVDVISDFEWCQDFAAARNENLRHAVGKWYMYIDDDEWFGDCRDLIAFFLMGEYKYCDGACYIQRNYHDRRGTSYSDDYVSRMVCLTPERHFVSKIHEYLVPVPIDNYMLSSYVEHYGYIFDTEEDIQSHYERNSKLLLEMIEEEPDNQRWRTHLAQELIAVKDYAKLRQLGEEGLALLDDLDDPESTINRGTFYMCRVLAAVGEADSPGVLSACDEIAEDARSTSLSIAYASWWKARIYMEQGDFPKAEEDIVRYLRGFDFYKKHPVEYVYDKNALLVGKCYDNENLQQAYQRLICAGLKQGNSSYLRKYLDDLDWDQENPTLYDDMMDTLITAFATLGEKKLFVRTLRKIKKNDTLLEYFCQSMIFFYRDDQAKYENAYGLCREAGCEKAVEYALGCFEAEENLRKEMSAGSYPEYREYFLRFSQNVTGYYEEIYGREFRDQDELPADGIMALLLEQAFAHEDKKNEYVEYLKQAAQAYPALAQQIKELLRLYLEEPYRKKKRAQQELLELKEQVIAQVSSMMEAGQYREAHQILVQMKEMIPDDMDIASLCLEAGIRALE